MPGTFFRHSPFSTRTRSGSRSSDRLSYSGGNFTLAEVRNAFSSACEECLPAILARQLSLERENLLSQLREALQDNTLTKSHSHTSTPRDYTPIGNMRAAGNRRSRSHKRHGGHPARPPPLPEENAKLLSPTRSDPTSGSFFHPLGEYPREFAIHAALDYRYLSGSEVPGNRDLNASRSYFVLPSREQLSDFSRGHVFEHALGATVLLNAFVLGLETHFLCVSNSLTPPLWLAVCEKIFCAIFTAEIMFRISVQRSFFFQFDCGWNLFDLLIVFLQLSEQVCQMLVWNGSEGLFLRYSLELLRPIRIVRLMRVVRNFESLRSISAAIAGSMKELAVTMVILFLIIFACSVMFTQVVIAAVVEGTSNDDDLKAWFGTLVRTHLTLFESILGGVSWDEAIRPLITEISPLAGLIFVVFIAFSVFAVANMVTGVFVEKATKMANDDATLRMASKISDLFQSDISEDDDGVTWERFEEKLLEQDMQDYFKEINVDPSEARILFKLLDADESGSVDASEIVDGLLRLHGAARALDLKILHYEVWRVRGDVQTQQKLLGVAMESLDSKMQSLINQINHRDDSGDDSDSPAMQHRLSSASSASVGTRESVGSMAEVLQQQHQRSPIRLKTTTGKVARGTIAKALHESPKSEENGFWSRS